MNSVTPKTIYYVCLGIVMVGVLATLYFSWKGAGRKPLRGRDATILNTAGAISLFLYLGSRLCHWWPMVPFNIAIAGYFSFMAFAKYQVWKHS
jgi:hypothetical protein